MLAAMNTPTRVAALVLALAASSVQAKERLVLMGGGDRPPEALARFAEWAGGREARVLVVAWASSEPAESFASIREDFAPYRFARLEMAPQPPLDASDRASLARLIERATGVFFAGGDQVRIMDVLRDQPLLESLRARYRAGVVFGGTSAGTACMSSIMITGEGDFTAIDADKVEVRAGIGLLPGVILDQHFVKRQRENRLFGLVLKHPGRLGVGIDEDSALLVEDNRYAEVAGRTPVMVVDGRKERGALVVELLSSGDAFDLEKRKRSKPRR
jgi:cyanophycinase